MPVKNGRYRRSYGKENEGGMVHCFEGTANIRNVVNRSRFAAALAEPCVSEVGERRVILDPLTSKSLSILTT